jgi:hypothetical protein
MGWRVPSLRFFAVFLFAVLLLVDVFIVNGTANPSAARSRPIRLFFFHMLLCL